MLVIPTQEDVVIEFRNTWVENGGIAITVVTLFSLAVWAVWTRQRRKLAEARAEA